MTRARPNLGGAFALLVALAVLGASVVAPAVGLLVASLRVRELALKDGRVLRIAGTIREEFEDPRRPDGPLRLHIQVPSETDPDAEPTAVSVRVEDAIERNGRTSWSFAHHADVVRSKRTRGLFVNSLELALGAGLLTLLLGIPVGYVLHRTRLPGRGIAATLLAVPLLLPTFFAAMGLNARTRAPR